MRVLLLDVNCKYSSTGKIVYDLYTQLRKDGHDAAIAYGRGPLVKEENIYRFSPKWEVYLHALFTRITGYTGCYSHVATKRLLHFMDKYKPDVVHLNDLHGYFVNIIPVMEYLKKRKIKTVWTFHCEFMYTGKCGHSYECENWKMQCGNCPHLKDYPKVEFFDRTQKMFLQKKKAFASFDDLTIVTPSQWLADRVKRSFLKTANIQVIYNGIDVNTFCCQNSEELKRRYQLTSEKIVLAVAPDLMSENKGGKDVVEVARRSLGENIKFFMIGLRDTKVELPENIIPVGLIRDQQLLAKYYSMADVFLICSKRENFPTTCIEAICCGTPVVGYHTGGTAETAPEELGRFVEYGDINALIKAIHYFLESENSDRKEQCMAYGREHYSRQSMYESYLKLYEMDNKGGSDK